MSRARVWFNGRTNPFQGLDEGSIPFTRSKNSWLKPILPIYLCLLWLFVRTGTTSSHSEQSRETVRAPTILRVNAQWKIGHSQGIFFGLQNHRNYLGRAVKVTADKTAQLIN